MTEEAQTQFRNLVREAMNECFATMTAEQIHRVFYDWSEARWNIPDEVRYD
jgi:hypothetical protein